MKYTIQTLPTRHPRCDTPAPVVVLGAGGIVQNAHLPAYRKLGVPVRGIFDINTRVARSVASKWNIPTVFDSLQSATDAGAEFFDIAVPATAVEPILKKIPRRASVLIQKPPGGDLKAARRIARICKDRELDAAVNFQLRFSPNMIALRHAMQAGLLGEITDAEVRVSTHTPWTNWSFLAGIPRLEILYHSIHYVDLFRYFFGTPAGVHAVTARYPDARNYADVKSTILLRYPALRCVIHTNHHHTFGEALACSYLKIEGTRGAAIATMGVNINYPKGDPDGLKIFNKNCWRGVPVGGSWFIDAFLGPMSNLQRHRTGDDPSLVSPINDAVETMAVVEACYQSAGKPGTRVPKVQPAS